MAVKQLVFIKAHGGYYNDLHDLLIVNNGRDWDFYKGNEWGADAPTKRELIAFANRGWNV
tara:strand:+ start:756 stop:935 length:180 start_codon:yes stop_codon:yes gene_type:complete